MAATSRRVVITGIGIISPIGLNAASYWRSLEEGRSGVRPIRTFDASGLPVRFAGEIPDFNAKDYVEKENRKSLRVMARTIQLAVAGAQRALEDGKVDKSKLDPTRFGVEFGAGLIATELLDLADAARVSANCQPGRVDLEKWGEQGIPVIQPLWMLKYLPNMLACHISILHDAQGPNNSITESDVASLLALGEAYRILVRDQADFFLVGGAESKLNPLSMVAAVPVRALVAHATRRPSKACRPFDRQRDGLVLGEGAGVLVVEELEHARKRGAESTRKSSVSGRPSIPTLRGDGLARAVRAALAEAGIGPRMSITSTRTGCPRELSDAWEARNLARGVRRLLASGCRCSPPRVTSATWEPAAARPSWPPACWAWCTAACRRRSITNNLTPPVPSRYIPERRGRLSRPFVVKVSFTQMGQCAAMVVRQWNKSEG